MLSAFTGMHVRNQYIGSIFILSTGACRLWLLIYMKVSALGYDVPKYLQCHMTSWKSEYRYNNNVKTHFPFRNFEIGYDDSQSN